MSSTGEYIPRIDIEKYPAIKKHLDRFSPRLESRTDQGDTPYNLRSTSYMEDFSKQKIVYGEIAQGPKFYLDSNGFLVEATGFIMTGSHLTYLIQWLNSDVITYIFKHFYAGGGLGKGFRYKRNYLLNLPIPLPEVNSNGEDSTIINDDLIMEILELNEVEVAYLKDRI